MIEELTIKNFRCHKAKQIKFTPGINVITGPNDTGKSAIIDAIVLVCMNDPSGDNFISDGAELCSIKLQTDDHLITRVKSTGSGKNYYKLDGVKLTGFKMGEVPKEVQEALNIGRINFQFQTDKQFLLSDTPGKVGEFINQMLGIENIDETQRNLASLLREENKQLGKLEDLLIAKKEEVEILSKLSCHDELIRLIDSAVELKKKMSRRVKDIANIDKFEFQAVSIKEEKETIDQSIKSLENWVTLTTEFLSEVKEIEDSIEEKESAIDKLDSAIKFASITQNSIVIMNEGALREKEVIEGLEKKYADVLISEGICPTCNRKVTKKDEANIIRGLAHKA